MRKLSARPNGDVHYVFYLTDDMLHDCFLIANMCRPENAQMIYNTMSHQINSLHHIMMVYKANGHMYGFVKGHVDKEGAHIDWLFVDPRCQRFGIGAQLLTKYESWCSEFCGARKASLFRVQTLQAKNFYAKMGYQQIANTLKCCKDLGR